MTRSVTPDVPALTGTHVNGALPRREPDFGDVHAAAERLNDQARRTPLLTDTPLDSQCSRRVLLKLETLQHTGSFKFRGAYNRLVQIEMAQRPAGVVAFSSGNHAQGIAAAAARLNIPATVVMPSDAPRLKLQNTRALGAEVIEYDRRKENREDIAARIAAQRGSVLVPSFDDPDVIAGQGTAGIELAEQAAAASIELDDVLVPCSGGGLVAGIALALHELSPRTRVWCVEPGEFNDHQLSLRAGQRVRIQPSRPSICDALLAPEPGEITFEINRRLLAGGLSVTDDEVRQAIGYAARELKLVLEPGGAVALAALLARPLPIAGRSVAIVLSGANIDPAMLAGILAP